MQEHTNGFGTPSSSHPGSPPLALDLSGTVTPRSLLFQKSPGFATPTKSPSLPQNNNQNRTLHSSGSTDVSEDSSMDLLLETLPDLSAPRDSRSTQRRAIDGELSPKSLPKA